MSISIEHEEQVLNRALILESMEIMHAPLLDYIKQCLEQNDSEVFWEEQIRSCFYNKNFKKKKLEEWDFPFLLKILETQQLKEYFFAGKDRTERATLEMDIEQLKVIRNLPAHDWPASKSLLQVLVGRGTSLFTTFGLLEPAKQLAAVENRSYAKPLLNQAARVQQASYYLREAFHEFVIDLLKRNEKALNLEEDEAKKGWGWEEWGQYCIHQGRGGAHPPHEWDSLGLLRILRTYWERIFQNQFKYKTRVGERDALRGFISDLEVQRKDWAHGTIPWSQAVPVLHQIQRMITLLSRTQWYTRRQHPKPLLDWVAFIDEDIEIVRKLEGEIEEGHTEGLDRAGVQLKDAILSRIEEKVRSTSANPEARFNRLSIVVKCGSAAALQAARLALKRSGSKPLEQVVMERLASIGYPSATQLKIQVAFEEVSGTIESTTAPTIEVLLEQMSKRAMLEIVHGKANKSHFMLIPGQAFNVGRYDLVYNKAGRVVRENHISFIDPSDLQGTLRDINATISRRHGKIEYNIELDCFIYINEDGDTSIQRQGSNELISIELQDVVLKDGDTLHFGTAHVRYKEAM